MKFRHRNINEDMEYRDHVVENCEEYVNDFLTSFSRPVLQYVGEKLLKVTPVEQYSFVNKTYYNDYAIPVIGDYYLFIAAKHPGDEKENDLPITEPQWNALRTYSAANSCMLCDYVRIVTIRHFNKIAAKTKGKEVETTVSSITRSKDKNHEELVSQDEIFDLVAKIFYDQDITDDDLAEDIRRDLRNALNELKDITPNGNFRFDGKKDFRVLELCCMYDYKWDDIADELREYFPEPIPDVFSELSDIEKKSIQTRIAQWKKRAILHLTNLIYKSHRYKYINSAVIQHRINRKPQST